MEHIDAVDLENVALWNQGIRRLGNNRVQAFGKEETGSRNLGCRFSGN